jgi:hypothetical protein
MLVLLLAPPAVVQTMPATTKLIEALMEALEGVPAAFIEGTPAQLPDLLRKLKVQWEGARRQLATVMPAADLDSFGQRLAGLAALRPPEQAEAALDLSGLLASRATPCRAIQLLNAERITMLAWCRVDARRWDALPNLAEAFRPVLDSDGGRHPEAVDDIRASLERLRADRAEKSIVSVKRTLGHLIDLLDDLD